MSPTDAPLPGAVPSRVLQPAGATPAAATHLDPDPRLRPGELLVALELVAVDPAGETAIARTSGGEPERQRAALLEATTERGGLPPGLDGAAIVGRVTERAAGAGAAAAPGRRVGIVPPVGGVALWLRDVSRWHGGRFVPCQGHAVVAADAVVVLPERIAPEAAALLTAAAHVPTLVRRARSLRGDGTTIVLGAATVAGALAVRAAVEAGHPVVGVVASLGEARIARALGAAATVIAPLDPPADGVDAIVADLAATGLLPTVTVVLADDRPGAAATSALLAARLATDLVPTDPRWAADLSVAASGVGSSPLVVSGRTLRATADADPADLTRSDPLILDVAAWRAGIGEAPSPTRAEDP